MNAIDRPVPIGDAIAHDSAAKHVSGEALYIDDMPEPPGLLHAFIRLSDHAHARITRLDVSAVAAMPCVAAVMTAADIPGVNDVGPAFPGDPIFADGLIEYCGQSLFAVAAGSIAQAREAALHAVLECEVLPAIVTVDDALAADSTVLPTRVLTRGDAAAALACAPHRLSGRLDIGGQEHFYLEGQVAMAIPGEDGDMLVYSSTQHPTEVQHLVARALKLADHAVVCETRRMGGAFGGKESQASLIAAVAALLAQRTKRPVKLRLDRDDDMVQTGKRHGFRIDYDVGFDAEGRVLGVDFMQAAHCGFSPDLSAAIADRAMFHADNCYYLDNARIVSYRCKTHTVSNTAFRGFGGPQGMMGIEYVIDEIARYLLLDPLLVRQRNFYGTAGRNVTPYDMTVEDNIIPELVAELAERADYAGRRAAVAAFNAKHRWIKRGIALTPVKFGISFTLTQMNQAGALVHVYTDGSVMLNHGGTEMGQGLYTKVAQVVAAEFGLPVERVKITATSTAKVPNTSPTAASSGSDINGKAAQAAAVTIRERIAGVVAAVFGETADSVVFAGGMVGSAGKQMSFAEAAKRTHAARVSLSSTGYYRTPKIHYDGATLRGRPFYYFAYGAAVSEVEIDTLTGEYRLQRVDILHDCGASLNPALDLGQIEGGFVQGMGWLTSEELWWDGEGRLRTHAPSTYKIPAAGDVPAAFNVSIYRAGRNQEEAIYRSKAVGEPPLMLGISVFHALKDAVAATGDGPLHLDAPATPERVLLAVARRQATIDPPPPLVEGGKAEGSNQIRTSAASPILQGEGALSVLP
jgi:xanthine dehydrogenase large subunit